MPIAATENAAAQGNGTISFDSLQSVIGLHALSQSIIPQSAIGLHTVTQSIIVAR